MAAAVSDPTTGDPAADTDLPWFGALAAAGLCMLIALIGFVIAPPLGALFGAIGMPGTVVLAYRFAPAVAKADGPAVGALVARLSFESILIADALVVGGLALQVIADGLGTLSSGSSGMTALEMMAGVVSLAVLGMLTFLFGAVIVGVPAALVVVPAALIWSVLVRRAGGRTSRTAAQTDPRRPT